ncbi:unnamed protein product [Caenorhabditis sp. 36 PRJEB53466]|nr:unnamed protein product [Caenorhabditis sp. 36 PRJEB53466]
MPPKKTAMKRPLATMCSRLSIDDAKAHIRFLSEDKRELQKKVETHEKAIKKMTTENANLKTKLANVQSEYEAKVEDEIEKRTKQQLGQAKKTAQFFRRQTFELAQKLYEETRSEEQLPIPWKVCDLCVQQYEETGNRRPKVIPCGHTACAECIANLCAGNSYMVCPFDRKFQELRSPNGAGLPTNFAVLGM